ncbi:MAG: type II secretion system protein [Patescibacteria group bacterium]|nr:type II secretion system protein [Patescibacteria group bacterium]
MNTDAHPPKGFSIVEILVAAAIIAGVGIGISSAWQGLMRLTRTSAGLTQAAVLSEETGEALELFRDQGWKDYVAPLADGGTYYLYWNGSAYATSTTPVPTGSGDGYDVGFTLSSVERDTNGNVVGSGGTTDPDTVLATISVAYANATSTPISSSQLLIHDVFSN